MRLAFLSDIHGNAVALDAVLEDISKRNVDKIIILGDISYRGPEPKRALELVKSLHTNVIKGNADEWVVRGIKEGEVAESALQMMKKERDWIYKRLDEADIRYLAELPTETKLETENIRIHAFHATPDSLFDVVQPFESDGALLDKMMKSGADIFIYAHIHKPFIRYIEGKCLINIGSVGLPFDGLTKSSYAIVDLKEGNFQTSIVRVDFDLEKVIKQYQEEDYPNSEQMIKVIQNARI
jgi:putative phosphoesterase